MHIALYLLAAVLILAGLAGALVPALPGIPLIFGGIWLAAATDRYRHLGRWWLIGIALIGCIGIAMDLLAGALGAKRVGASRQAIWGAAIGTVIGLFFGVAGLVVGPFLGAVAGEFSSGSSALRAADVGMSTWVGLILGTLVKLVVSLMMVGLLAAAWWLGSTA